MSFWGICPLKQAGWTNAASSRRRLQIWRTWGLSSIRRLKSEIARHYLENLIGNPMETGVAAAHLVMAGVPGRFPRIRFVLAHAGGVFPMLCGRLQRGFETKRPGVDPGVEPPLQAARRFWADGIAHHPAALDAARAVFGADHVVFGSDWPFPMGTTPAAAAVDAGSYKN